MKNQIAKISPELLELMGSRLPNSLQPFSREIFLLDIVVAGTTHCNKIHVVYPELAQGQILRMQRHPKNRYDKNAIALYYNKVKVGWVPRELNLIISRHKYTGKAFFCSINTKEWVEDYWVKNSAKINIIE